MSKSPQPPFLSDEEIRLIGKPAGALTQLSGSDAEIIRQVADRACALAAAFHQPRPKLGMLLDLSAAHQTIGLCLDELLAADDGNFGHDVFGIQRHMNRDTGKLENGFMPRFAKPA